MTNKVFMFNEKDIVRHKNGDDYIILDTPEFARIEETNEPAYYYTRADGNDKRRWMRSQTKMEDGRFTLISKGVSNANN